MNFLIRARNQFIISKALRIGIAIGTVMLLPHLSWFIDPFVAAKLEDFFDLNTLQTLGVIFTSAIEAMRSNK